MKLRKKSNNKNTNGINDDGQGEGKGQNVDVRSVPVQDEEIVHAGEFFSKTMVLCHRRHADFLTLIIIRDPTPFPI